MRACYYFLPILWLSLLSQSVTFGLSQSKPINIKISNISIPKDIKFNPPPEGEPPDTSGAGSRDPDQFRCFPSQQKVASLMPKSNYSLTLQQHPKIYFYLPQTNIKQVVIAFQDENESYHQTAFLPVVDTNNDQFVSFQLPSNKSPLTPGKYYKWKLTFVCGETPDVEDPTLEGWVKRVQPNSVNHKNSKNAIAQAKWYAANGYWYDLLMVLDEAIQNNPQNPGLKTLWNNLLQSNVDLEVSVPEKIDEDERNRTNIRVY